MQNLQGTKTQANLIAAYSGECQAANKYIYYSEKAEKDGYNQIADIFRETAKNEREHAKIWFKLLAGGEISDTQSNLDDAAQGEHYEWVDMYHDFAIQAREEGFEHIAFLFDSVAKIEAQHENRFLKLLDNVKNSAVFSKDGDRIWICQNCGNVIVGKEVPNQCPVCKHPKAYFEIKAENY